MPTFEEARTIILDRARPLAVETVPVLEGFGRVAAEDLRAPADLPAWDNSAMDGYAVRADDVPAAAMLPVSAYVPAGARADAPLEPGTAVRILTGAPLPEGADAVVPVEETEEAPGGVRIPGPVRRGAHVRRRGEDFREGDVALAAGTLLGAPEVSFLASCGRLAIPVHRRPRVAILSTGDELVEPGDAPGPGQIRDSNALAVAAAVLDAGGVPVRLGIARDEPLTLRALLERGLEADVLVTTAGVSVGDRDLVRRVLEESGASQAFWKVDVKPGRPTAFATRGATLVFSLPGNPVSTLMTFDQFVRPALLRLQGRRRVLRPVWPAVLDEALPHRAGRVTFARVALERRDGVLRARSAGNQETGILRTMLRADGVALLPPDRPDAPRGATVPVQILRADFDLGPGPRGAP
jgi:molybdopterin molybdotransferase